jgi:hypothetical protein
MYIVEIDNIVNNIIDDFYYVVVNSKSDNISIVGDTFIQSLSNYFGKVDNDNADFVKIKNRIKQYLNIYIYLWFLLQNKPSNIRDKLVSIGSLSPELIDKVVSYYEIINKIISGKETDIPVSDSYRKKFLDEKNKTYHHNLIKLIMINKVHKKNNRLELFESYNSLVNKRETKSIDIVIPKDNIFNYFVIQNILKDNPRFSDSDIFSVYDFISRYAQKTLTTKLTNAEKAKRLIESKYVIPISNDFLRYHKDDYFYIPQDIRKESKMTLIVDKMNKVKQLYNKSLSKVDYEKYMSLVKDPERMGVLFNQLEDIKIITRIYQDYKNKKEITDEYYKTFVENRNYAYQDFKDFPNGVGINKDLDKTTDMIRHTNIKFQGMTSGGNVETRVAIPGITTSIIGIVIPHTNIKNININDLTESKLGQIKNNITDIFDGKKLSKSRFLLFTKETDETTEATVTATLANIYDHIVNLVYRQVNIALGESNDIDLANYELIMKRITDRFYNINTDTEDFINLNKKIFAKSIIKIKPDFDEGENKLVELKDYVKTVKYKRKEQKFANAVCQHILAWKEIRNIDKNNQIFNTKLHEFIKKFMAKDETGENINYYFCKSCDAILGNIINYVKEGAFNQEGDFVSFYTELRTSISEMPEYLEYSELIDNLDRKLELTGENMDISYLVGYSQKLERDKLIKKVIDILQYVNLVIEFDYILLKQDIKFINDTMKKGTEEYESAMKEVNEQYLFGKKEDYGVKWSILNIFQVSKFEDKNNVNIAVAYMFAILAITLTKSEILMLKYTQKYNYYIYEKYKNDIFGGVKLKQQMGKSDDSIDLLELDNLAYIIYMLSGFILENGIWYVEDSKNKLTMNNQKIVIHTIVDILNNVIQITEKNIDELYRFFKKSSENLISTKHLVDILKVKIFSKVKTVYTDTELSGKIKDKLSIDLGIKKKKGADVVNIKAKRYNIKNIPKDTGGFRDEREELFGKTRKLVTNLGTHLVKYKYEENTSPTTLLVCENTGVNHEWDVKNVVVKCKTCNKTYTQIVGEKWNSQYNDKYNDAYLEKVAWYYCTIHGKSMKKCVDCSGDKYQIGDKVKFSQCIHSDYVDKVDKRNDTIERRKEKFILSDEMKNDVVINLKVDFDKNKGYLSRFLNLISKNLDTNTDIFQNAYQLTHNYVGNLRESPVLIASDKIEEGSDKDNAFFKTAVISFRIANIEYFYDKNSLRYLGYLKGTGSYIAVVSNEILYLKKVYSVNEKIIKLGIHYSNYDAIIPIEEYIGISKFRNGYIKNFIREFQTYLYNIRFKKKVQTSKLKVSKKNLLLKKYEYDLSTIDLSNIFKDWEIIFEKISHNENSFDLKSNEKKKLLTYVMEDLNNNLLVYYLIRETMEIIKNNPDRENVVCSFFYDYLNIDFDRRNIDLTYDLKDKTFKYIIDNIDPEEMYYEVEEEKEYYTEEVAQDEVVKTEETDEVDKDNEGYDMYDNDNDPDDMHNYFGD